MFSIYLILCFKIGEDLTEMVHNLESAIELTPLVTLADNFFIFLVKLKYNLAPHLNNQRCFVNLLCLRTTPDSCKSSPTLSATLQSVLKNFCCNL